MSFFHDFISLIYPRICVICGNSLFQNEDILCTPCQYHLPKTNFHLLPDNPIKKIFWGRIPIESATSFLYFIKMNFYFNIFFESLIPASYFSPKHQFLSASDAVRKIFPV